jgi:hypothetical protein
VDGGSEGVVLLATRFQVDDRKIRVSIFILEAPEIVFADDAQAIVVAENAEGAQDFAIEGILDDGAGFAIGAGLGDAVGKTDEDAVPPLDDGVRL